VERDVKLGGKKLDNTLEEVMQAGYKQEDTKEGLLGEIAPEPLEEEPPRQQFRHLPAHERLRQMREEQERRTKEAREKHEAKRQELKRQQVMRQQLQVQPTHQVRPAQAQKIQQYQQPKTQQLKKVSSG